MARGREESPETQKLSQRFWFYLPHTLPTSWVNPKYADTRVHFQAHIPSAPHEKDSCLCCRFTVPGGNAGGFPPHLWEQISVTGVTHEDIPLSPARQITWRMTSPSTGAPKCHTQQAQSGGRAMKEQFFCCPPTPKHIYAHPNTSSTSLFPLFLAAKGLWREG